LQFDDFREFRENPLQFRIRSLGLLMGCAEACPIGISDARGYLAGIGTGVARADSRRRGPCRFMIAAACRAIGNICA